MYSQVAKLFQNQEDLLAEFGQFLPDANGSSYGGYVSYISAETYEKNHILFLSLNCVTIFFNLKIKLFYNLASKNRDI